MGRGSCGWENCHLHMFRKGDQRYSRPGPWRSDFTMPGTPRDDDERKYRIDHLLKREKDWITYMYDFGDRWEHRVTLQKILPYDRTVRLPACVGGQRRCPPEDCGGVGGYYEMLDSLEDPNARDHEHMKEWIGGHFDPEAFSAWAVDMLLGRRSWGGSVPS